MYVFVIFRKDVSNGVIKSTFQISTIFAIFHGHQTYRINDQKTEQGFYRFLLRHPIDLVEIWRKLTYIHHWSWIIKEIWIFQNRDTTSTRHLQKLLSPLLLDISDDCMYVFLIFRRDLLNGVIKSTFGISTIFAIFHGH